MYKQKIYNHIASHLPDLIAIFVHSLRNKKAFTLVELSIVIVIIGLLVGGVTAGMSLVSQAKLRSVTSDINKIKAATNTFKLQYNSLPGDLTNATAYWGRRVTAMLTPAEQPAPAMVTVIVIYSSDTSNVEYEPWHFWKHLANAKLWPGDFTGYSDNTKCSVITNFCMEPGKNTPEGAFSGSG